MKGTSKNQFVLNSGLISLLILSSFCLEAQHPLFESFEDSPRDSGVIRIAFYNVENLFDPWDDSLHNDEAFLPGNIRGWNYNRYTDKLHKIYQVLAGLGGWSPPEIVGLAEVENKQCVRHLIEMTPLNKFGYRIIQEASPDFRGIELSMIYRPTCFRPIEYQAIEVNFPFSNSTTRDILYIYGRTADSAFLHLFFAHWPSKYGGEVATIEKRNFVAELTRQKVQEILAQDSFANVIIMGDLNDEPESESVYKFLSAGKPTDSTLLINLMAGRLPWEGTHKHQGHWGFLDQIILSRASWDGKNKVQISSTEPKIYGPDWLMEKDELHLGEKPYRTFLGMRYIGGFSDHLAVYLDLIPLRD
jgi:hypothetical protein